MSGRRGFKEAAEANARLRSTMTKELESKISDSAQYRPADAKQPPSRFQIGTALRNVLSRQFDKRAGNACPALTCRCGNVWQDPSFESDSQAEQQAAE